MTKVLVLNTGSSSLKWTLLAADEAVLAGGSAPWAAEDSGARGEQVRGVLAEVPEFDVVGHRVVHGGTRFREAVVIDQGVREALAGLSALDPEHMHASLMAIDAVSASFPN